MADLSKYRFETSYYKVEDDIVNSFYIPCMERSVRYDRASGYFGSSVYYLIWPGLRQFINNGGKIRLICSPFISESDQKAIDTGYLHKPEEMSKQLSEEIFCLLNNPETANSTKALAYLVSTGVVQIKICVNISKMSENYGRLYNFFHDKYGLFYDDCGNTVMFSGPVNETFKGLDSVENGGNIEHIDINRSWLGDEPRSKINNAEMNFKKLWWNAFDNIDVIEFPDVCKDIFKECSKTVNWEELLLEIESHIQPMKKDDGWDIINSRLHVKTHQLSALNSWVKNNYRGILKQATGSGKTYTAACAVNHMLKKTGL